ncbi:MAG: dihydrolipoamide acetyltransferase family protein [Armatimonadota bacterium]
MPEITMPKMSDTMEEGKVIRWLKHEGEHVASGESVAEIETDKANVEMEAFSDGTLTKILVPEGESAPVGTPIAELSAEGAPAEAPKQAPPPEERVQPQPEHAPEPRPVKAEEQAPREEKPAEAPPKAEERIPASPLARKIAEERGIDLAKVKGTGPGGRVVESDVEAYASGEPQKPAERPAEAPPEGEELSRIRRTIAERMTNSKQTIPHFYVTAEAEMDFAGRVRDELNMEGEPSISFTDMVVKACALALRAMPEVNASYRDGRLVKHKEVNVGIAVALSEGLVVPVVRGSAEMPLREIARTTKGLASRAREGKSHVQDFGGGTFTVSNLGMFDVESFAAIINPPESATLAVGSIREVPAVVDGAFAVARRMKMTISCDHRVMDGAVGARFLNEIRKRLESPITLL